MADYLSAQQVRDFDKTLRGRHASLLHQVHEALLGSDEEQYQALAGRVHDVGEQSVADLISDLNIHRVDQLAEELYAVEGAMARLRNGSYGICEACGNEIGVERLQALPSARRCVECQERYEREHHEPATPTM